MITRRKLLGAAPAAAAASAGAPGYSDVGVITESLALLDAQEHLRTGSDGDAAVAAFIRSKLHQSYRLHRQAVSAPSIQTRRATLSWDNSEIEIEPLAISQTTGPDGLRAPLRVWRDSSDDAAVSGALAIVVLASARHSQLMTEPTRSILARVAAAGARAIVLITSGPTGELIFLNVPLDRAALPPVPIALAGARTSDGAIAAARAGKMGTLIIDGAANFVRSDNIWGILDRGARCVVVSTPRTAWTPAVAERGPGLAAFLALAEWAPRALSRHTLIFVSTTAHEFDNAGSHRFLERHAPEPERVALWVHLGAGFAARDFHEVGRFMLAPLPSPDAQRFLLGTDSLIPLLRHTFAGQVGLEAAYPAAVGAAGELSEILARGYAPAFGLFGAHRFHHVMQDRLDKTSPAWIQLTINALKTTISSALE